MKLQYWVTIAVAGAFWAPACVSAQGMHDGFPFFMPHSPVSRHAFPGSFVPNMTFNRTLPNRRVPSLAPPQFGDIHPVTPAKAWSKPLSSTKPARPSVRSGRSNIMNDDALFGRGPLSIEGPLEDIGGADSLLR